MGIRSLNKLVEGHAPRAIKRTDIKTYRGRKLAIDASTFIYQFLVAIRSGGKMLANRGETTSHLAGLFYRTIKLVQAGIRPVYVFDGIPPELKQRELQKRGERRKEAGQGLARATEIGDASEIEKYAKRTVRMTEGHISDCIALLELMGIPAIRAPGEAEAQCAQLSKEGLVYGAGSEDMDTLVFSSPVLIKNITAKEGKKASIIEIRLDTVLKELEIDMDQFVDLCILLGCDYCKTIKGIGPSKAIQLVKRHKNIETILQNLRGSKYAVPDDWEYEKARELFIRPLYHPGTVLKDQLVWKKPREEELVEWMVHGKGFSEELVRKGIRKLTCALSATQSQISSFFQRL